MCLNYIHVVNNCYRIIIEGPWHFRLFKLWTLATSVSVLTSFLCCKLFTGLVVVWWRRLGLIFILSSAGDFSCLWKKVKVKQWVNSCHAFTLLNYYLLTVNRKVHQWSWSQAEINHLYKIWAGISLHVFSEQILDLFLLTFSLVRYYVPSIRCKEFRAFKIIIPRLPWPTKKQTTCLDKFALNNSILLLTVHSTKVTKYYYFYVRTIEVWWF